MIRWLLRRRCDHDWHYDDAETRSGSWSGYIEKCSKCHALRQIPQ